MPATSEKQRRLAGLNQKEYTRVALELVQAQKRTGIPHTFGERGNIVPMRPRSVTRRVLSGAGGALLGGAAGGIMSAGVEDRKTRLAIGLLLTLAGGTVGGILGGKKYPRSRDYDTAIEALFDRARYDAALKQKLSDTLDGKTASSKEQGSVTMPSSTERQRRFFGAVMAAKKGKKGVGSKAREAAKGMSEGTIKDFLKKKGEAMNELEQAYWQGFMSKCAEVGVDPQLLVKVAATRDDAAPSRIRSVLTGLGGSMAGSIGAIGAGRVGSTAVASMGENANLVDQLLAAAGKVPGVKLKGGYVPASEAMTRFGLGNSTITRSSSFEARAKRQLAKMLNLGAYVPDNPMIPESLRETIVSARKVPNVLAHEVGHAINAGRPGTRGISRLRGPIRLASGLPILPLVATKNEKTGLISALVASGVLSPMLAEEIIASHRGNRVLASIPNSGSRLSRVRSYVGIPSYVAATAAPVVGHLLKKWLGGYRSTN